MTGTMLNDRYELHEEVGSGGMAIIYAATDHATGWKVAVKMLRKEFSNDNEFVLRFRREAQAVANLDHPNIVSVYDVGQDGGIYYMVMEFVDGITLKDLIREQGVLTVEDSMRICLDICGGLKHAHEHGVIHRDVKPHNILVSPDQSVKITDFGIAKFADSNTTSLSNGNVMGSVHYISPEQARGEDTSIQTDIYSLGVTLYEMLTGKLPFEGDTTVAVAMKHINDPVTPPEEINPKIPHSLSQVVMKAMDKDVDIRYDSCGSFARDLMRSYSEPNGDFVDFIKTKKKPVQPIPERPTPPPAPPAEEQRRSTVKMAAVILLSLGVLITLFLVGRALFSPSRPFAVVVPDVAGLTPQEAKQKITESGLVAEMVEEASSTVEPGLVIRQEPTAGVEIDAKSVVRVMVSTGQEVILVPDLSGKAQDVAEAELTKAGLKLGEVTTGYMADVPAGLVISQVPAEGTELPPGEEVDIVLSQEAVAKKAEIPSVVGGSAIDAIASLKQVGFENIVLFEEAEDDAREAGTVTMIKPAANESYELTTLIQVYATEFRDKPHAFSSEVTVQGKNGDEYIVTFEENGIVYGVQVGTLEQDGANTIKLDNIACEKNDNIDINVLINGKQVASEAVTQMEG